MSELKEEVYRMFNGENVTILIQKSIKKLVVKEMRKYIEALELEYEFFGGSIEVAEDIRVARNLFSLILTNDNENIKMTVPQFLVFESMLYCSSTLMESFRELNYEYSELYKSIEEIFKMLDKSHSEEYIM
ncbi:hypothetical protein [Acetivibrio cellulolyticus]|uniref:hypothetical protein n=1 Tax=Acetivibrio cellulolyticus TaxID=35830 RepID=UPI0001E2D556|nr:hypothetical protein [Acetivibrio cellulolyticus]